MEEHLAKILSQGVSRIFSSINVMWSNFVILYCISDIMIPDVNMFGPFLLYWIGTPEE